MKSCNKKYSTNFSDTRGQLAMMPGVWNPITSFLSFFATSPFLILGLLQVAPLPTIAGPTQYPNTKFNLRPNADQNADSEWLQALFIAMGFANAQPEGVSNGMTAYNTPGNEGFSEYMYRYLNPTVLGAYYNTYVMPSNEIIKFWADEITRATPAETNQRLRELAYELFLNASLPLYNPPGLYEINLSGAPANTEPYHDGLQAYLTANTNTIYLLCQQQNSPDIAQGDAVPNPFANTLNSINFAGGIPDAILWV